MTNNIFEIVTGFLLLGIIVLGCHDYYEAWELLRANNQIHAYETQISNLESQAMAQEQRVRDAETRAQQQMRHLQDETKVIVAENVPHDCDKAVQWAIQQSKSIRT